MGEAQVDLEAVQRLVADAETAAARLSELTVEIQRVRAQLDVERRRRESAERTVEDLRAALARRLNEEAAEAPGAGTADEPAEAGRRRYVSVRPRGAS